MSFEIKYDRDGQVSGNMKPTQEIIPLPQEAVESYEVEVEETVDNAEVVNEPDITPIPTSKPQEDSYQARNFRTLRDDKARSDRERDEALAKLRAYEMQQYNMQQQAQQQSTQEIEDVDIEIGTDDIAEGKHIKALAAEVKKLRGMVKQTEQRSTVMTEESKLLAKYPDYYNIVSSDSIARLQAEDPELAQVLGTSTDVYGAKAMAYKAIKKMAAVKVEPTYEAEKAQIQKNAAKPKPLASLSPQQGDSPLSRANAFANGLTPALQEQLRREMNDARRNM
jgi:Asp-tRNA(Asn)/Glu-tRNA(Gln) amidotransferase C subunit